MKPIRWLRRGLTLAGLGAAGSAAFITVRHVLATPQPLENRLFGDVDIDRRREGDIYYTAAGPREAEPFVLLHDFYAGASNYEYRRLYPRLAADHRVYAPDWLGFGLSERPALAYTGEFYARLLNGFLRDTVGRPATVVAHGLAANVAARAASEEPALFTRLVLIEPRPLAGTLPGPTFAQTAVRMMQRASLGLVPYAVLSTRPALRLLLARHGAHQGEGAASDDALDEVYANAHQFGGHHALLALLTGELDLPIENVLPLLEPPLLIVGGEGTGEHPRSTAGLRDLALLNASATIAFIPEASDFVQEDQPAVLMEKLDAWLQLPAERATPQISETRATARFPAGAIRVEEGASPSPTHPAAEPPPATSSAPAAAGASAAATTSEASALAREPRESAQLQPPASSSAAREENRPTEELGEPYGLVSAHPHLDVLEGLEDQAPEIQEPATSTDEADASTTAVEFPQDERDGQDEAAAQVVGKPAGELEAADQTGSAPSAPPAVTTPERQASEKTPAPPASPSAQPSSATSVAPASGARSVRTQRGSSRSGDASAAQPGGRNASGRNASGKSSGRPSTGSSGKPGSSGGRKSTSHRPKKS